MLFMVRNGAPPHNLPPSLPLRNPPLTLLDLLKPRRLPQTNRQMHHQAPLIRTMPMHRTRRTLHQITGPDTLRHAALVAHPPAARFDLEDLPVLVAVPERAAARQEGYVVAHYPVFGRRDFVHVYRACECVLGLRGRLAPCQGRVGDYRAWHACGLMRETVLVVLSRVLCRSRLLI